MPRDEYYDEDSDDSMPWESEAESVVKSALKNAEFDDIRGVVAFPSDIDDYRYGAECSSLEEVTMHLIEEYDSAWYANVPFDSGEAVFDSDSSGFVSDLLAENGIEAFFEAMEDPDEGRLILSSRELVEDSNRSHVLRIDMQDINEELIRYLAKHPEYMRELAPRRFEELVAEIFKDKGYEVTLTPRSNDGGLDILAIERSDIGAALSLVECKRYAPTNRVGVDIVRGLYGVVEQKKASRGIIVTTSYFTRGAIAFRNELPFRLSLTDFDMLSRFVREWGGRRRK